LLWSSFLRSALVPDTPFASGSPVCAGAVTTAVIKRINRITCLRARDSGNLAAPRELAEFLLNRDGECPMTFNQDSEVYIVRDAVWGKAGMEPYGGCLCIGCLEKRIGRKLKRKDFPSHPFNLPGLPCTERLRDRRGD
jgi:hypothetical protein